MLPPLCIYHRHCPDGFAAAWVVRHAFLGEVELLPASYGDAPPDVTGRQVFIVDFSYSRRALETMVDQAESLTILDHHISAREAITDLPGAITRFAIGLSGAMLAWRYFFQDQAAPQLLRHIEDRDLWLFHLEETRAVMAGLLSHPYDFGIYDFWMSQPSLAPLAADGQAILRQRKRDLDELLPSVTRPMIIGGHYVQAANLPPTMASDAGHILAKHQPFAATYSDGPGFRKFSLRSSSPDGLDVAAIAQLYGGGGHRHAAGFRIRLEDVPVMESGRITPPASVDILEK